LEDLIGKKAYKKRGFFSDLIGVIEKSDNGITPYKLVFKTIGAVGFRDKNDIVIIEDDE
jgi:hypothetical protein